MTTNPTRIAIVSQSESWYARQLQTAGQQLGMDIDLLAFGELQAELRADKAEAPVPDFDAAIVRTMPLGSLEQVIFRMDLLRHWQNQGLKVFNSPVCLETCIDKSLTLMEFARIDVPFPDTVVCQTWQQAMTQFETLGGDVVVKPVFGGEGRGILRVCESEMAHRVFKSLEIMGSVIYLQRFIGDCVRDLRILFVGDRYFSMTRHNPASFKTNISAGGTGRPWDPSPEELELARKAKNCVGGEIVGVDLLVRTDGSLLVLEVNGVPGWKMLQRVTGADIAKEVMVHVRDQSRTEG